MSLNCEISGEPLLGISNDGKMNEIVATPTGHLCIKRLLLTKLSENGGLDPFESTSGRELPLSEDQLVTLQSPGGGSDGGSAAIVPPRSNVTSLPNLLGMLQKEYDALVLELFDTRKVLEETRRELSQALYQNDAAIRVVARISQERDAAKQQLEQWDASAAVATKTDNVTASGTSGDTEEAQDSTVASALPSTNDEEREENKEPTPKRRRLEADAEVLKNDIPDEDIQAMTKVWTKLSKERKPILKAAAAKAPTSEILAKYEFIEKKSWHKSSNRGIPSMTAAALGSSADGKYAIVTAGKDKQLIVYNESDEIVEHTFAVGYIATSIDVSNTMVVTGNDKGKIAVFSLVDDDNNRSKTGKKNAGEIDVGSKIVDIRVHPTDQHIITATDDGRVVIACWVAEEKQLQQISSFETTSSDAATDDVDKEKFTSAALHPDGLVYIVGTDVGRLLVWDFKNKKLAATMDIPEGEDKEGISAIAISSNGYTIAVGYDSGTVRFWNLIKQKVVGTYKDEGLDSINVVAFDKSGKYAAMGGKGGIKITTVKKWDTTVSLETKKPVSAIVWSESTLEASFSNERAVHFYGVTPNDDNKMEE